jgi:hypothetical protein
VLLTASADQNWLEENDYLAAWLQGLGTIVALVAIIVALEHFRRGGFRARLEVIRHKHGPCLVLNLENRGRATGRVDQLHVGHVTRTWRHPIRRDIDWPSELEKQPVVRLRHDMSAGSSPLPLALPGSIKESLAVRCDPEHLDEWKTCVIVIAGGRRKIKRLRWAKRRVMLDLDALPELGSRDDAGEVGDPDGDAVVPAPRAPTSASEAGTGDTPPSSDQPSA